MIINIRSYKHKKLNFNWLRALCDEKLLSLAGSIRPGTVALIPYVSYINNETVYLKTLLPGI
jgi:hypothetical protein